jgi:hypothetical protein
MWNASDLLEKVSRDVEAADLCIHQVARTASNEPETAERARLQLERAVQSMKSRQKPPPLVWIQPAKDTDRGAQALIGYIENDLSNAGVEHREGSLGFQDPRLRHAPLDARGGGGRGGAGRDRADRRGAGPCGGRGDHRFSEAETDVKVNAQSAPVPAKNPSAMAWTLASCGKCTCSAARSPRNG